MIICFGFLATFILRSATIAVNEGIPFMNDCQLIPPRHSAGLGAFNALIAASAGAGHCCNCRRAFTASPAARRIDTAYLVKAQMANNAPRD